MDSLLTDIQRVVEMAKDTARYNTPQLSEHGIRGRAVAILLAIQKINNNALLYLMREMEMHQSYRDAENGGFEDLRSWAYATLEHLARHDTLMRLCGATLNLIAPLDAEPIITPNGEKINGLALITNPDVSASAVMDVYGMFAANEEKRTEIVEGLLTKGSDSRAIKEYAGWQPSVGKADALFYEYTDEDGIARTMIKIEATYDQSKLIEKSIERFANIHFSEMPI